MNKLNTASRRFCLLINGPSSLRVRDLWGDKHRQFHDTFAGFKGDSWDQFVTYHGELPREEEEAKYDGFVLTGSIYDAHDEGEHAPWIRKVEDIVRRASAARKKIIGICFGHQLIANALGGRSHRADPSIAREDGVRPVTIVEEEFSAQLKALDIPQPLRILQVHQDQVHQLPTGATLIGQSPRTPHEAYKVGNHVLCLQGHPEMKKGQVEDWILDEIDQHGLTESNQIALDSLEMQPTDRQHYRRLFRWFLTTDATANSIPDFLTRYEQECKEFIDYENAGYPDSKTRFTASKNNSDSAQTEGKISGESLEEGKSPSENGSKNDDDDDNDNENKDEVVTEQWAWKGSLMYRLDSGTMGAVDKIACFDFDQTLASTAFNRPAADDWEFYHQSVPSKLTDLHKEGYKLVIFTNQSNIGRCVKPDARKRTIARVSARLESFLSTIDVPFQVYVATGKDKFRKPGTGMWPVMVQLGNAGQEPDMAKSFYVGDAAGRTRDHSDADQAFAESLQLPFYTEDEYFK